MSVNELSAPLDPASTDELRSWNLSSRLVTSAPVRWQALITVGRAVCVGTMAVATYQAMLDDLFGAGTVAAADLVLAHVPTAVFAASAGPDELSMVFDLVDDADLGLAAWWSFGDGSDAVAGVSAEHTFPAAGVYGVTCTVVVAGTSYATSQTVTVGPPVPLVLEFIDPTTAPVGPPTDLTLFVYGAGITPTTKISFGGNVEAATKYLSPSAVSLEITAGLFPNPDADVPVSLVDGARTSPALSFSFT